MTPKKIVGLMIRTTNENGKAKTEIAELWQRFMNLEPLPSRLSDTLYGVYFDYEKDYTKPYNYLLGYEVSPDTLVPEGLVSHTLPNDHYQIFEASGSMPQALIEKWVQIWQAPLNRAYKTDFEIYNSTSPSVPIYIGIKN
jgi:predicted transcriptional regulator YdeE